MTNCIEGTLAPYGGVWGKAQVKHLYNRLANGANLTELTAGIASNPNNLVDALIDETATVRLPDTDFFPWAALPEFLVDSPYDRDNHRYQLGMHFMAGQVLHPVKYKLAVFWHNHFVTETNSDTGPILPVYLYYRLLHECAMGNFKTFTEKMGLNPNMLFYLNGRSNIAGNPNENYARELLELFTVGEGNYMQEDVVNIATGLTGWYAGYNEQDYNNGEFALETDERILRPDNHDWGEIELFGETYTPSIPINDEEAVDFAYQEYLWIHDTIFSKKEELIAKLICRKLYRFYVYEIPNEDIVSAMAMTFMENDWEIIPVLKQLFKSEHFFDVNAYGIQIKSPCEMFAEYIRKTGFVYNQHWFMVKWGLHPEYDPINPFSNGPFEEVSTYWNAFWWWAQSGGPGQSLFNPPNVAGWPGGRTWINEDRLLKRWNVFEPTVIRMISPTYGGNTIDPQVQDATKAHIRNLMIELTDNSTDVDFIVRTIIDYYMNVTIEEEYIQAAITAFKGITYSESDYTNGTWNLSLENTIEQFRNLIRYLLRLPEFQLI